MKRKSVAGFVTGLIGILAGIPIGYYMFVVFALVFGLGKAGLIYELSVWALPLAGIFAIVGVCFMFTKSRIGGNIMLLAFALYVFPFVLLLTINPANILVFGFGLIPAILFLVSGILGIVAKPTARISVLPNKNNVKPQF